MSASDVSAINLNSVPTQQNVATSDGAENTKNQGVSEGNSEFNNVLNDKLKDGEEGKAELEEVSQQVKVEENLSLLGQNDAATADPNLLTNLSSAQQLNVLPVNPAANVNATADQAALDTSNNKLATENITAALQTTSDSEQKVLPNEILLRQLNAKNATTNNESSDNQTNLLSLLEDGQENSKITSIHHDGSDEGQDMANFLNQVKDMESLDTKQSLLNMNDKSTISNVGGNANNQNLINLQQIQSLAATDNAAKNQPENTIISAKINTPVGDVQWDNALSERVLWLTNQSVKSAEIHLNPPNLGPLNIHIKMDHEQASVYFSSQQPMVRDALEQALPKLREVLQMNGLNLANVNVSDQSLSQQSQAYGQSSDFKSAHNPTRLSFDNKEDVGIPTVITPMNGRYSMVDYYV